MSLDIKKYNLKFRSNNSQHFLNSISKYKIPTVDEELFLFESAKNGDKNAKEMLFMGHQRLIYSMAKYFSKNEDDIMDYVSEGNIGLYIAFNSYNPSIGVRFITYAAYYIRREMNAYCNKTNNMIQQTNCAKLKPKIKAIKKEYFNEYGQYPDTDTIVELLKEKYDIDVKNKKDVYDVTINSISIEKDDDFYNSEIENLYNTKTSSLNNIETITEKQHVSETINRLLGTLTQKERDIMKMLFGIDEYDYEHSLDDVANKYNTSPTVIKNIKNKVIEKLKYSTLRKAI